MSKYKVMGWYQYRVYKYIEADSKEQAIDIACQGSPLHEWNLEINQGAYREEVESAEEDNSIQITLIKKGGPEENETSWVPLIDPEPDGWTPEKENEV